MNGLYLISVFVLVAALPAFGSSKESENRPSGDTHVEEYHYQAIPIGKEEDTEQIDVTLSFEESGLVFTSDSISKRAEERISVTMTRGGELVSGTRRLAEKSGTITEERIWREGEKAYIERTSGKDKRTTSVEVPDGATLAVEASLLVLFRCFPYQSTEQWQLFVIDFTGKSMAATALQTGVERLTVPAGEIPCYRVEIRFHVLFLNPKVVVWIARGEPHVVVRSVGKRGLLTPTYVTSLVREHLPESLARQTGEEKTP